MVFTITNQGSSPMRWQVISKQPDWIMNVDPKGEASLMPGAKSNVSIQVHRRRLNPGQYHHEISIRYNDESGNILTVPFRVTMSVPD